MNNDAINRASVCQKKANKYKVISFLLWVMIIFSLFILLWSKSYFVYSVVALVAITTFNLIVKPDSKTERYTSASQLFNAASEESNSKIQVKLMELAEDQLDRNF